MWWTISCSTERQNICFTTTKRCTLIANDEYNEIMSDNGIYLATELRGQNKNTLTYTQTPVKQSLFRNWFWFYSHSFN